MTEKATIDLGSIKPLPDPSADFSSRCAIKQLNTTEGNTLKESLRNIKLVKAVFLNITTNNNGFQWVKCPSISVLAGVLWPNMPMHRKLVTILPWNIFNVYLKFMGDRFHIHILKSKDYNLPFEVSKVASKYCDMITATIQTMKYWIRWIQCHLSYVKNVSDTMPCLKTTFLMWHQAICGEFCSYRQLPAHLARLGRSRWTTGSRDCIEV